MQPPGMLSSGRFSRTGYLPTYAAAMFLLVLVWAGAPGRQVDFGRAWQVADKLGTLQVLVIALAVALVAVLLQPLQLSVVRVLEGNFPRWLGSGLAAGVQVRRRDRMAAVVAATISQAVTGPAEQRDARIQKAGVLAARLRSRFPSSPHLIRPTALGNALTAMEDTAGAAYGLDAAVAWPRLYPLVSDRVRAIVDDLRDGMDAAARLAATAVVTAIAAAVLLAWHSGLFTLLALVPLAVAVLSYAGAVRAAIAYGASVEVAFDLHRFDLLNAMHMETPVKRGEERLANMALSDFLRQGVPVPFDYVAHKPDAGRTPLFRDSRPGGPAQRT